MCGYGFKISQEGWDSRLKRDALSLSITFRDGSDSDVNFVIVRAGCFNHVLVTIYIFEKQTAPICQT